MKIDILGHNNFALAIIFDLLREKYNGLPEIRLVSNLRQDENMNSHVPFCNSSDQFENIYIDEWQYKQERNLIIGATASKTKRAIFEHFSQYANLDQALFINIFHHLSYIASSARKGKGIIIEPNATISSFAHLEDHIWVKRNVSIGHHTSVGKFTNVNPGSNIAGNCKIGSNCLIGVGVTINDGLEIGSNSIIGSGSIVTKNIPENVVAYGVPAKIIGPI